MDYAVTITAKETAELLPLERPKGPVGLDEVAGKTLVTLISAGTELASAYLGQIFLVRQDTQQYSKLKKSVKMCRQFNLET